MESIEAFLKGIKPALFERPNDKLLQFPYVEIGDLLLFFQSVEQKQDFVERSMGLSFGSPGFDRLLGFTLGYPPRAIEYYVKTRHSQSDIKEWVFREASIHYVGQNFVTSIEDLRENVQWVWDTYSYPEELYLSFVRYENGQLVAEMIPVDYRNHSELEKQTQRMVDYLTVTV